MDLRIDRSGSFPVAHAVGDLCGPDAGRFTEALYDLVSGPESRLAVVLSELQSIDSSGLSALISLVTRARLGGGQVVLVAPTSFVAGVFNVSRLDRWFDLCSDLDEARRQLS